MPTRCVPNVRMRSKEQRNLSQEINRWTQKEVFASRERPWRTCYYEPRGTNGRGVRQPLAALTGAAKESWLTALKTSSQPVRVRSAFDLPPAQRSRSKVRSRRLSPWTSNPVRDGSGTGQRRRTLHQRTEGGLEHRGLSRDARKERRRTPAQGHQTRIQAGREGKPGQRLKPSPSQRLKPSPTQG